MNLKRVWYIFIKDMAVGPRSPFIIFVMVMPLLFTLVLQLVFGNLMVSKPRLALVDEGDSVLSRHIAVLPGIELSFLADTASLLRAVEANDHDAGLILPAGFDKAMLAGDKPPLQLYFSGESFAMNRLILAVSAIDVVRAVEGSEPPVDVQLINMQEGDAIPLSIRFVPVIVFYAFVLAGLFVPASTLVEEKERRTLTALLSTPAKIQEVILAKALLGIVLAFLLALVSLLFNGVVVRDFGGLLVVLLVSAVFWSILGLLVGLLAKNSEMLFAIVKGSGVLLFAPVIFYLFPDWPQWIARLFPTFWAIDPLWQMVANEARLIDVLQSLIIVCGMCLVALPAVLALGRRALQQQA
jgi:ABC-2 type transport system permease protein